MTTIGYGEDGLTYWSLTSTRHSILNTLEVPAPSDPADSLLFYRPSFGRAGGLLSSPFGEFDAIMATPRAVYLIESKWDGSAVVIDQAVILAPEQTLRHQIFRWIRDAWEQQQPTSWAAFATQNQGSFAATFQGKPLARPGTKLADNLEYVLSRLTTFGKQTVDILLYFHRANQPIPQNVVATGVPDVPINFSVVSHQYDPINRGGFFAIPP
jgi:hypothetical protein